MPDFDAILDQQRALRLLNAFLQHGTIPHALLFTGIDGVGKRSAAVAFAMACNCTAPPSEHPTGASPAPRPAACGECGSCRKIASGSHPDVVHVAPKGAFIRIEQIRELLHTLSLKPFEGRYRVAILSRAQALTPEAGNALLKILEEPPDHTLLLVTASNATDLLPTIVSRCQPIPFRPISVPVLQRLLVSDHMIPPETAAVLAVMAMGSVSKALSMHAAGWVRRRDWLLGQLNVLERMPVSRRLAFAERLLRDADGLEDTLAIMAHWYRDVAVFRFAPDRIVNADAVDRIEAAARRVRLDTLQRRMASVAGAQKRLRTHGNPRLTMEVLALDLAQPDAP